jgi:hypothetical protein
MRDRQRWLWRTALAGLLALAACDRVALRPPEQTSSSSLLGPGTSSSAGQRPWSAPGRVHDYDSVLIGGVPHVRQRPDFCGEAAAEMWLSFLGEPVDQDQVFALSGMPPERGMGATTRELKTALEQLGFSVGPVWSQVRAGRAAEDLADRFRELHADLVRGVPSIVCMHYDDSPRTTEHFRLVLGFDRERDEVVFHDPAVPDGAYTRMPRKQFLALWPLHYDPERWTVIRLRLASEQIRVPRPPTGVAPAELAQHVRALRRTLPTGFTVVVEPPFVVVGNDSPERVRQYAAGTVRWAVERLRRDFFSHDPSRILDVWLLKDASSYRRLVVERFGGEPSTPYGFYSSEQDALVMNIATGGGTLVHEIVHPFMEANFDGCPAWFNEGLGSLFEQSADRAGHIVGRTNWRLAGLQQAIRDGSVPTFRWLMATTSDRFYGPGSGLHYAQARYLLYYLQERGLLRRYYREFVRDHDHDPTGYRTLLRLVSSSDPEVFQEQWERYVLGLRFP